jgi:hypothetical protein
VREFPVRPFAAAGNLRKAGVTQLLDQFADFSWHVFYPIITSAWQLRTSSGPAAIERVAGSIADVRSSIRAREFFNSLATLPHNS